MLVFAHALYLLLILYTSSGNVNATGACGESCIPALRRVAKVTMTEGQSRLLHLLDWRPRGFLRVGDVCLGRACLSRWPPGPVVWQPGMLRLPGSKLDPA